MIGVFLETHVSESYADHVLASTVPGWRLESNYDFAELGRIWVVWDPAISVVIYKKTDQLILCGIYDPASQSAYSIAFIYVRNTETQRRALWEDLSQLNSHSVLSTSPWLMVGDYNQILTASKHYSIIPSTLPLRGMDDMRECFTDNGFIDLPSRGAYFTWKNCRPEDPILRKLDRAIANEAWLSTFPDYVALFKPPADSDHVDCIISLDTQVVQMKSRFMYFSFLASHPAFTQSLLETWSGLEITGSPLFMLNQRLKAARCCLRKLNREGFSNITQRAKAALVSLEHVQSTLLINPTEALFREEEEARKKFSWLGHVQSALVFFSNAQEVFFKQKSRIIWLDQGDANTTFFHKSVVANWAKNSICYLVDDSGSRVSNP